MTDDTDLSVILSELAEIRRLLEPLVRGPKF